MHPIELLIIQSKDLMNPNYLEMLIYLLLIDLLIFSTINKLLNKLSSE